MKLIIEIDPAGLTGFDIRQGLATVWDAEYDDAINGKTIDLDIRQYGSGKPNWCGTIRAVED